MGMLGTNKQKRIVSDEYLAFKPFYSTSDNNNYRKYELYISAVYRFFH